MLYTHRLLKEIDDPDFVPRGPPSHPVLRYGRRELVAAIYEEHVDSFMQGGEDETPPRVIRWLRGLEAAQAPGERLFRPEPILSQDWWDRHVRSVVLRRSGTRITLPLEEDIPYFLEALQPFFLPWAFHVPSDKRPDAPCDVSMYPAVLLRWAYRGLVDMAPPAFKETVAKARSLVPGGQELRLPRPPHGSILECAAAWPGLRAYPPFYMDIPALQDPPARRQQRGQWVVIHALGDDGGCFAKASATFRGDAVVDDVGPRGLPWPDQRGQGRRIALQVGQDAASDAAIAASLKALSGWVPLGPGGQNKEEEDDLVAGVAARLLPAHDPDLKARLLAAAAPGAGLLFLPERPFDRVEAGFTYTPPEAGGEDPLYAVPFQGDAFHLSSYVGFGLRLRLAALKLGFHVSPGRGVCVVVPDSLEPGSLRMRRVEATAKCWLRGLCDTDKGCVVLPERTCVGAALLHVADRNGVWACVHDGPGRAVAQVWQVGGKGHGLRVLRETGDAWQAFVQHVYDHTLNLPEMEEALDKLAEAQAGGPGAGLRQAMAALRQAMPDVVGQMNRLATAPQVTVEVPLGEGQAIQVRVARDTALGWLGSALHSLEELRPETQNVTGVLVSGGLFERIPDLGAEAVAKRLNVGRDAVRPLKVHALTAGLLHVYGSVERLRYKPTSV